MVDAPQARAMSRKERRAAAARESGRRKAEPPSANVPDAWRADIAANLVKGASPDKIVDAMVAAGVARESAAAEVAAAQRHPYILGAAKIGERLRKRDWLLGVQATLWRLSVGEQLEVARRERPSTEAFLNEHYLAHRPVIITGALHDWPAMEKWSLDYFDEVAGDAEVEVQFGRDRGPDYEHKRERYVREMTLRDYTALIRQTGPTNNFYVTANNGKKNREALAPLWDDIGPISDYLTEIPGSDGFFWLGPQGTLTPYHHDLTNNLLAQVVGRKRVRMTPSFETPLMRNWLHCYSSWGLEDLPVGPAREKGKPPIVECVLEPGDILFIPVGWWHHVEALDVSVSMSFTNFKWYNNFVESYRAYGEM